MTFYFKIPSVILLRVDKRIINTSIADRECRFRYESVSGLVRAETVDI